MAEPFELLHRRCRCIGFDHRGSGASSFPPQSISPTALVDDLFRVLDHFEVETCVLAGESLGALTCLLAALRDPSRFTGLVLVAGAPAASKDAMRPLVDGSRTDYPATVRAFVDACVPEPDCDHIWRWARQILLRADPEAAARVFESHYEENAAADITQIAVPTLLIHGEDDAIIPVDLARAVAAAISGAEIVVLPSTGHLPTMTRAQTVADEIERWAAARAAA